MNLILSTIAATIGLLIVLPIFYQAQALFAQVAAILTR
jgi:uncharacterized membrane protein